MQSAPPAATLAYPGRPTTRRAPAVAKVKPAYSSRALTAGTICLALYLAVVHTYKLPLGTAAILGGLFSVALTVRPLRANAPIYYYMAFMAWSLVTLPAATNVGEAWLYWVDLLKIFLVGCLAFNAIRTPAQHRFITLVWLALFAFYPVRGTLFNFLTGNGAFGRYGWNFAFSNFNDMASLSLMPLAMSFERMRSTDKWWIKLCALCGILVLPFIILITQSRAGMLGLAVMFLYLFAGTRYKLKMASAVVGVALVAIMFAPQGVWDRIRGMQYLTKVETLGQSDSSAEGRYVIWQVAFQVIRNNPVIGVGIGNYPIANEETARQKEEFKLARGGRDTHSLYLRLLAEVGPVGLGLYLMIYVTCFLELRKKIRELKAKSAVLFSIQIERARTYQAAMLGLGVCAIFGSLEQMVFPFLGVCYMAASLRFESEPLAPPPRKAKPAPAPQPVRKALAAPNARFVR